MDWCRLDTSYYLDPALLRAGEAAEVLFLRLLAYSGNQESGGRVPAAALPMLCPVKTGARVAALVREKLVYQDGDDVVIRSWGAHQERFDSEVERRRKDRERKRSERQAARESAGPSTDSPQDVLGTVHRKSARKEVEVEKKELLRPADAERDLAFEEFWLVYPRKIGKGQARKAWERAVKTTDVSTVMDGVLRFARMPAREERFTPHPATWLNGERWLDVASEPECDPQYAWDV